MDISEIISSEFDWKNGLLILLILIFAFILSRSVRWLIRKSYQTASEVLQIDPTRYKFFRNAASVAIWALAIAAIVSLIPKLRTLAISLFATAGIMVAVIGFAAQAAFANIIGGIFIVMFKPFRVGDFIRVGQLEFGTVEDITLRHTVLLSFENKRIIIPNSTVSSETILNETISDSRVCKWIEVGISYDSDIDKAMSIMQEVALNHPDCIDGRSEEQITNGEPIVRTRFVAFQDSSLLLRAFVWTRDSKTGFQLHSDLNREIKRRFDEEGIEIPYPYRTLVYKNSKDQS
jgi:small-conductance mechanosensitive channel